MPQRARIARIAFPIFLVSAPAGARETRQLTAVRVGPGAIQVDGSLDDPGWAGVAFTAGFLQKRPVDGGRAVSRVATPVPRGRKRSSQVVSTRWVERLELLAQRR